MSLSSFSFDTKTRKRKTYEESYIKNKINHKLVTVYICGYHTRISDTKRLATLIDGAYALPILWGQQIALDLLESIITPTRLEKDQLRDILVSMCQLGARIIEISVSLSWTSRKAWISGRGHPQQQPR